MKTRLMTATEFKAKCLAVLAELDAGGAGVTITKRGRPVATLQAAARGGLASPAGMWAGAVRLPRDLVTRNAAGLWEAVARRGR